MVKNVMHKFSAKIELIGINPFVFVPVEILTDIFKGAGKGKGAIPVCGTINGAPYKQTLVKFSGDWRLYINTTMLKNSPKRIGEHIEITIGIDLANRKIAPHPKLIEALRVNNGAKIIFESLRPSLRYEIIRYIGRLKTEESIDRNVNRAIDFLLGHGRFIGRDKP